MAQSIHIYLFCYMLWNESSIKKAVNAMKKKKNHQNKTKTRIEQNMELAIALLAPLI